MESRPVRLRALQRFASLVLRHVLCIFRFQADSILSSSSRKQSVLCTLQLTDAREGFSCHEPQLFHYESPVRLAKFLSSIMFS